MTHHPEVEKIVGEFEKRMFPTKGNDGIVKKCLLTEKGIEHLFHEMTTTLTSLISRIEEGEWTDTKTMMPDYDVQVLCALKSFNTGKIIYCVLERKERDDAVWFDGDGEIDVWNWTVVAWRHIPSLSNPPSQV